MGLLKKLTLALGVSLILVTSAAGGFLYQLLEWSEKGQRLEAPMTIPFKSGTGLSQLAQDLEDFRIVDDHFKFHWYVRIFDDYRSFQAGLYQFEGTLTPKDVILKMQQGQVYRPVALQITIPEGFTLKNITERLAANGVGHIVNLQSLVRDRDFIGSLKINAPTLEGYLYPATYTFEAPPSPHTALSRMVQTFFQNLPKNYEEHIKAKGLSLHEAVTFASLIELETQLEEEKPLVSEVIWNRLKAKMPLGIDAALIYGIPDYKGDILWSHLSDKSNPYNTRIHPGLPPTPIGSPGVKSLEAILTPSDFGYLYYVNIPGTVRHHFSKTLKEHNEQVKKLVEATKRPPGASLKADDDKKAPLTLPNSQLSDPAVPQNPNTNPPAAMLPNLGSESAKVQDSKSSATSLAPDQKVPDKEPQKSSDPPSDSPPAPPDKVESTSKPAPKDQKSSSKKSSSKQKPKKSKSQNANSKKKNKPAPKPSASQPSSKAPAKNP